MKWILFIVITMSYQNDGRTPVTADHIEFRTERACREMKAKLETAPKPSGGGLMGAVNAINGVINSQIVNARCESVDDTAGE